MTTLRKSLTLILIFICFFGINIQAQDSTAIRKITAFSKHFSTFSNDYPQEKVYLHFDNSSYFLGETLWFKAYVVKADRHGLSQLSKILYVELITPEGNVVETKKFKIENGQCNGDFKFPTTRFAGFFEVRAYTRYMLNFDPDNIFSRVFPLYDKPSEEGIYKRAITERALSQRVPQVRKEYSQKENINLTFFPEGGNLVTGLKSKIAFKATGKNGENISVSGIVSDDTGNKITDFTTDYLNMGVFEFIPGTGKYTVKAQYQNKDYTFEIPKAFRLLSASKPFVLSLLPK